MTMTSRVDLEPPFRQTFADDSRDPDDLDIVNYYACEGDPVMVQVLMRVSGEPNLSIVYGISALAWTVMEKNAELCQEFIEAGAELDIIDDDECTALVWATYFYYKDQNIIKMLVRAGARLDAVDNH
jgi:hypothetical protein